MDETKDIVVDAQIDELGDSEPTEEVVEEEKPPKPLDLIILTKTKIFWLESLISYLENNSVNLIKLELEEEFLTNKWLTSKHILIQEEDFRDQNAGLLKKLVIFCELNKVSLILYGSKEGVSNLKNMLPDRVVSLVLVRPGDTKILGQQIINRIFDINQFVHIKQKSILAVDDSGFTLRTLKSWLEEDYDIRLANSAAKAMTMLSDPKPDLILLDYEMPICSGAQFMAMLQAEEQTSTIPVIFLTSKDDRATVTEVIKLKPASYLLKTTSKSQLIATIEAVLSKEEGAN